MCSDIKNVSSAGEVANQTGGKKKKVLPRLLEWLSESPRGFMIRLLNVQTLAIKYFDCAPFPPYAILSHTWGEEGITFQDTHGLQKASLKARFTKFNLICRMTAFQQLQYVWIDTCCIDKSSSAKLSEATSSMYQWYQSSTKCLVYLQDLPSSVTVDSLTGLLENCRWFSRGWTLQELVAARTVVFDNQGRDSIGEKKSTALLSRISVTGINQDILLADNSATFNRVGGPPSSLDGSKHHQDNQSKPFASFRHMIFGIASKCFEVYKPYWLSEFSNENGLLSQGASPVASFACPFLKMNAYKYHSCMRKPGIRTNIELMEHLNSIHRQPLYCPICSIPFQNIWTRNNHIRDRSCTKAELVPPPGISIEESNQLHILLGGSSMKPLKDEDWYEVWDVLFPERARPESPLVDRETEITMSALESFWMDHGSNLIVEFLASRGELEWRIPNEEHGLANLHSAVLSDLMDRYLFAVTG